MLPPKDRLCHRTGFTQPCRDLVASDKCGRWRQVLGAHPQTGAEVANFDCIDDHVFLLLLSLGKQQGETTASVDKVHNGQSNDRREHALIMVGLIDKLGEVGERIERAAQAMDRGARETQEALGVAQTQRPLLEHRA
jgi:hypothetical protein